jgi:hypothetical protein
MVSDSDADDLGKLVAGKKEDERLELIGGKAADWVVNGSLRS